jgi:hypothetical protein
MEMDALTAVVAVSPSTNIRARLLTQASLAGVSNNTNQYALTEPELTTDY